MRLSQCLSAFAQSLRTRSAAPVSTLPRGLLLCSREADGSTEGAVADGAPSHPFGVGVCWPQPRLLAGDLRESVVLSGAKLQRAPLASY